MKFLGEILHPKDLTTKEYVDRKDTELEESKVNKEDLVEYTEEEVQELWKKYMTIPGAPIIGEYTKEEVQDMWAETKVDSPPEDDSPEDTET